MAVTFKLLPLISLVGLVVTMSPLQLLAQPQPDATIATVTTGKLLVKQGKGRPQERTQGQRLSPTELISVRRGTKAKIRCVSNNVEWYIPADGLFRGVREFCP